MCERNGPSNPSCEHLFLRFHLMEWENENDQFPNYEQWGKQWQLNRIQNHSSVLLRSIFTVIKYFGHNLSKKHSEESNKLVKSKFDTHNIGWLHLLWTYEAQKLVPNSHVEDLEFVWDPISERARPWPEK